jgi:hypothetical protein
MGLLVAGIVVAAAGGVVVWQGAAKEEDAEGAVFRESDCRDCGDRKASAKDMQTVGIAMLLTGATLVVASATTIRSKRSTLIEDTDERRTRRELDCKRLPVADTEIVVISSDGARHDARTDRKGTAEIAVGTRLDPPITVLVGDARADLEEPP